jgi:hypothetical protein
MVWRRGAAVLARRTIDGGQTWLPVRTIAPNAGDADMAGVGARVDVAYVVRTTCAATGDRALRIFYRRSLDGGATWSSPTALTSACSRTFQPAVARSADGQVSVAWVGELTGRIFVRTSRDSGASFGSAVQAASTTAAGGDTIPGAPQIYLADPQLAIGSSGTTYLAYTSATETLSLRRSTNRGASWSAPTRLSSSALGLSSLVASGSRAIVGYDVEPFRSVYRTTGDRGATWSSQRSIYSLDPGEFSTSAQFTVDGGTLAVTFKFGTPGASPVWYRESTNWGVSFGITRRISAVHGPQPDPVPAGVALLDDVALAGYAEVGETVGLWVRRGDR